MPKTIISPEQVNNQWTLFLDRDGVINQRPINDYVRAPEDFLFLPGAIEAIVKLSKIFGRIIIVTNQQGVGLGLMTEKSLKELHDYMLAQIQQAGGRIDAIYACTMTKTAENNCRKPLPVMGDQAKADFPAIDFEKSVMLGDTESDMLFAKALGILAVKIGDEQFDFVPDYCFESLLTFALFISPELK